MGFSRWAGARPARFVRDLKCARSHWCGISLPPRPFCALPSGGAPVGPVAQRLEPAAHNGLVAGSSPARPTNHSRESPLSRIGDFGRPIMGLSGAGWDFGQAQVNLGVAGEKTPQSYPAILPFPGYAAARERDRFSKRLRRVRRGSLRLVRRRPRAKRPSWERSPEGARPRPSTDPSSSMRRSCRECARP